MVCAVKNTTENKTMCKTMEQLIQELGKKIAEDILSLYDSDKLYPDFFYDYFGIVFLLENGVAVVYGNTKQFIDNVKQGKIKFVRLL